MDVTPRSELAQLILDVRYGRVDLTKPETTEGLDYTARTALSLIRASQKTSPQSSIHLAGTILGDLHISGSVGGFLGIDGSIDGNLNISGSVSGNLNISDSGSVSGDLNIWDSGSVSGDLNIWDSGSVSGNLNIFGSVAGRVDLLRVSSLKVGSLSGASFGRPVFLGEGVDLSGCDFRGFSGFEQLRFVGSSLFGSGSSKRISHTQNDKEIGDVELAVIYRQLREVYERQSNRPEAGDFYYQEMNARRRASRTGRKPSPQWFILSSYWLISGYSQQAWKAFAWFAFIAAVSTWLFLQADLLITTVEPIDGEGVEVWRPARVTEAFQFSVQSMVSFFSPPKGDLDEQGRWYQLALRFIGPTILAQAILAIREKVAR